MVRLEVGVCVCVCKCGQVKARYCATPRVPARPPRSRAGIKAQKQSERKLKMSRIFITDGDSPTHSQPYKYAKGCYSLLHKNFIKRAGSGMEGGAGRG